MSGRLSFEYHNVRSLSLYGPSSSATQANGGSATARDVKGSPPATSDGHSVASSRGQSTLKAVPNVEERGTTPADLVVEHESSAKVVEGEEDEQPSKTLAKKVAETGVSLVRQV